MLLTEVKTRDGNHRVYFTRVNSVISYFEEDEDGMLVAHAEFGEFACPYNRDPEKLTAMRHAMLSEAARRLHVRPDQIEQMNFSDIVNVCDPPLREKYDWTGRARKVSLPNR